MKNSEIRKIEESLHDVAAETLLSQPVRELSSGMSDRMREARERRARAEERRKEGQHGARQS